MSVVSPHQTIATEALRGTSPGVRPPGSASPQTTSADRPLATAKRSQTTVGGRLQRANSRKPGAAPPRGLSLRLGVLEKPPRRRLPRMIYGFIAGAVETDAALRDNRRAFDEYGFVPRVLNDVSSRNQMTTLF